MQKIRVGNIGKKPCVHTVDQLIAVPLQLADIFGGSAGIRLAVFVADPVLSQEHIFYACVPQVAHQLAENVGVIFYLDTKGNLQTACKFLLQRPDSLAVVLQLLREHPHGAVVSAGKPLGCVIGKTENFQPPL